MTVSGALMGLVYALIAYGFQLTYATSKSINFGQGELVMVSAFFEPHAHSASGFPTGSWCRCGLLFGALLGLVGGARRGAPRAGAEERGLDPPHHHRRPLPLLRRGEHLGARRPALPDAHLSDAPIHVLGVDVTPLELSVAVGVLAVMALVEVFKRATLLGKAFEAVSADRDAGGAHGHLRDGGR